MSPGSDSYDSSRGYTSAGVNAVHAVPTKEPRVRQNLVELGASLELLEKSVIELGNKLSDVMAPEPPTPVSDATSEPHDLCVMADMVQSRIRHAKFLRDRIDSIISRLEV